MNPSSSSSNLVPHQYHHRHRHRHRHCHPHRQRQNGWKLVSLNGGGGGGGGNFEFPFFNIPLLLQIHWMDEETWHDQQVKDKDIERVLVT